MEGCHLLVSAAGTGREWGSGHGRGGWDERARGSEGLAPLAEPGAPNTVPVLSPKTSPAAS